jgi:hypothetical protein
MRQPTAQSGSQNRSDRPDGQYYAQRVDYQAMQLASNKALDEKQCRRFRSSNREDVEYGGHIHVL